MTPDPAIDPTTWPAVDDAYGFVLPSYQWLMTRFETVDARLTTLLTEASTITIGVPVLARAVRPAIGFTSPLALAGFSLFLALVIVGMAGRAYGAWCYRVPQCSTRRRCTKRRGSFGRTRFISPAATSIRTRARSR